MIASTKQGQPLGTLTRWTVSEPFFDLTCKAVYRDSLRLRRYSTLRMTVVEGLEIAIRATSFERFLLLKGLVAQNYSGNHMVHVHFSRDERRLLAETRRLLTEQSLERVLTADTLALAIHAHLSIHK